MLLRPVGYKGCTSQVEDAAGKNQDAEECEDFCGGTDFVEQFSCKFSQEDFRLIASRGEGIAFLTLRRRT